MFVDKEHIWPKRVPRDPFQAKSGDFVPQGRPSCRLWVSFDRVWPNMLFLHVVDLYWLDFFSFFRRDCFPITPPPCSSSTTTSPPVVARFSLFWHLTASFFVMLLFDYFPDLHFILFFGITTPHVVVSLSLFDPSLSPIFPRREFFLPLLCRFGRMF